MDENYFQGQVQQRDGRRDSSCASQLLSPRADLVIDFKDQSKFACLLTSVFFFTTASFL